MTQNINVLLIWSVTFICVSESSYKKTEANRKLKQWLLFSFGADMGFMNIACKISYLFHRISGLNK